MKISLLTDKAKEAFNNSHFKRNTAPKLMSLLFAIVFWIYVMDQVNPEMVKTFPHQAIELQQMENVKAEGLVVVQPKEIFADVTVKGRRSDVINAQASDVKLYVKLDGIHEGMTTLELKQKVLREGLNISTVSVSDVTITAERIIREEKPIAVRYTGSLPAGMTSEQAEIDKASALVEGPRSLVNKVVRIEGVVDLADVQDVQKMKLHVRPVDKNGSAVEGVQVAVSEVESTVRVYRVKSVPVKAMVGGQVAAGYKLVGSATVPTQVDVTIKDGMLKIPDQLMTKVISLNNISSSKTVKVELQLSDALKPLVKAEQQQVEVSLQVEKLASKDIKLPLDKIKLTNVGSGLNGVIKQSDGFVVIRVTDVPSLLDKISEETMAAYVDCNGLAAGEHKLKLGLELPVTPENVLVVPSTVPVELTSN